MTIENRMPYVLLYLSIFMAPWGWGSQPAPALSLLGKVSVYETEMSYWVGVYSQQALTNRQSVLSAPGEKYLQLRVSSAEFSTEGFRKAWLESVILNASSSELHALSAPLVAFFSQLSFPLQQGDVLTVKRLPKSVDFIVNGLRLKRMDDVGVFDLLARAWFGPVAFWGGGFRESLRFTDDIDREERLQFKRLQPSLVRLDIFRSRRQFEAFQQGGFSEISLRSFSPSEVARLLIRHVKQADVAPKVKLISGLEKFSDNEIRVVNYVIKKMRNWAYYPRYLFQQGAMGRATFDLTLDGAGELKEVRWISKSGITALDDAAKNALLAAVPASFFGMKPLDKPTSIAVAVDFNPR